MVGTGDDLEREAEVERKYAVGKSDQVPDFSALGPTSPARTTELVAHYYDTPRLDLLGAGITLRRRTGGQDAGWHLKLPRDGDSRTELRLPLQRGHAIPPELRDEVAGLVGRRPLLPVVRMNTTRTTVELFDDDGNARAEIVSDRVAAEVLRADVDSSQQWRELEVELQPGEAESTFDAVEEFLSAAGIRRSQSASKLAQVLRGIPPQSKPGRKDSAVLAAASAFAKHYGRFQALERGAAEDAPDAVHQARVALRRMRSILQVYGRVFDSSASRRLRDELRWAGAVLGAPRDAEVIRDELLRLLDELDSETLVGPVRARITNDLDLRHGEALTTLQEVMSSSRWDALHERISGFLTAPTVGKKGRRPAAKALCKLALKAERKVARRLDTARGHAAHLESWHEVRKAAKGARYAQEVLQGIGIKPAKQRRKTWKAVAGGFGEVQDAVILDEQLTALKASAQAAGEPVDTYQIMSDKLAAKREAGLADAWARVEEALGS